MAGLRPGRAATVTDRDLHAMATDIPGDPETAPRQRVRVQNGVAQQLAHHKRRIANGGIEDSGRPELGAKLPARHRDTGGRTWQEHDARRPHLPEYGRRCRDAMETSTAMASSTRTLKCPDGPTRKPAERKAAAGLGARGPGRARPGCPGTWPRQVLAVSGQAG